MSEEEACFILATWVQPISRDMTQVVANDKLPSSRRTAASDIATLLILIRTSLESLQVYWIESDVELLCRKLLNSLAGMCSWPKSPRTTYDIRDIIIIFKESLINNISWYKKRPVVDFFHKTRDDQLLATIRADCTNLYNKLTQDGIDDPDGMPTNIYLSSKTYFADLNKSLFNALELHTKCKPSAPSSQPGHSEESWHPARLCLSEEEYNRPSVSFLVSPMEMTHWQDFHLTIQSEDESLVEDSSSSRPILCELADTPRYARVSLGYEPSRGLFQLNESQFLQLMPYSGCGESLSNILLKYRLTIKDKVVLAYTIAQAYHQFYDSDLMRTKWTSETIWFMPTGSEGNQMPLRPYLSFPFGTSGIPEEDFIDDGQLIHRHPRILTIGILLLEIGLSKKFPLIVRKSKVSQVNWDHQLATNWLGELKNVNWNGVRSKSYFDSAVKYCLDSRELGSQFSKPIHPKPSSSKTLPNEQDGILARRKKFYNHVVRPLKWLAEKGFGHQIKQVTYISKNPDVKPSSKETSTLLQQPMASFHGGRTVNPKLWLQDLKAISAEVERQRRTHSVRTPVRVAILDTGFDEGDSWAARVKQKKSFVDQSSPVDIFGHGTLMARLVMECAPSAELIVARVSRNTKELGNSQENIKEAILWAGIECQADIISMSFGFPKNHGGISQAIQTVLSERGDAVIFLASAGNSPSEDENFPARHPSVLSIYATNCHGSFSPTNARLREDGPIVLGTYGDDLPANLCENIENKYPKICQPGSSVATAVAAGISATLLAYAAVLPHLKDVDESERNVSAQRLEPLRKGKGMEALFKEMTCSKHGRRWFMDPISFWRDTSDQDAQNKGKGSHDMRFYKISACLHDVKSKGS
ncbi:hypothetical protein PT974_10947 [Cladobotryum mycophilum]|uniref:Peptidase S8/S53 domain-containing protein n=1 Tax=Cladobotryum mycophilum TaxID=491253 RepID=A0ABR0SBG6_9HYPO